MKRSYYKSRSTCRALFAVATLSFLALASFAPFSTAQEATGEMRKWTDASGTRTIEAEFLTFKDNKVHLKKSDGTEVAVSMTVLSKADQEFIRQELARRRGATTPATKKSVGKAVNSGTASPTAGAGPFDWPTWRGPRRDGVSLETGLLQEWPNNGPPLLWKISGLGNGYSSVAVSQGKIYTLGRRGGETQLIALNEADGKELWGTTIGGGDKPNGTPTIDGDLAFGISHQGDLLCVNSQTGRELWRKSFSRDFGGQMMSGWGYSESPLVDEDRLICTPGGSRAMLAALDKRTGQPIWGAPMPATQSRGKDGAAYSSVVISNAGGVKQYVQLTGKGLFSVEAKSGQPLWTYGAIANGTANIPTPLVKDDFVFCSTGYDTGSALLKLSGGRGRIAADEVYFLPARELQNHHGGMIMLGDFVYCGNGHNNGKPACVNWKTGKRTWPDARGEGRGSAAIAFADGQLYFRYEDGTMALIEANPNEYKLKGKFELPSVLDKSWQQPVIANGRLYIRDQDVLLSYDVRKK